MKSQYLLVGLLALTVVAAGCLNGEADVQEQPDEDSEVPEDDSDTEEESEQVEETEEETDTTEEETEETSESEDEVRQVEITGFSDNSYDTEEVEVEQGETVEFVYNHDGGQHDLALEDGDGERVDGTSVLSASGESDSFTYTFEEDGDYEFYCSVGSHRGQGMEGSITVS